MGKVLTVLRFLLAALVRAIVGLSLTAVSTAVGAATVLTNDKAPEDWLSLAGLLNWFQADPQGASLLVLTGIGTAAGLWLSIFQVFFSSAGKRALQAFQTAVAATEGRITAKLDVNQVEVVDRFDRLEALLTAAAQTSPAGALPDPQVQAAQLAAASQIVASNDPVDEPARRAIDDGDLDQTIAALLDAAGQDARSAARNYRSAGLFAYGRDADQAIHAFREAVRLEPADVWGHIFLSRLYRSRGHGDAAIQSARSAVAAATDQRDINCALEALGDCLSDRGDLPAAWTAYHDSLTIRMALSEPDPKNTRWRRGLLVSYQRLGDLARQEGDLPAARTAYEDSLAIAKILAVQDPSNTGWQRDLALSYERLSDLARQEGDLAVARAAHEHSFTIAKALAEQDPKNLGWQFDLSICHRQVGDLARQEGDLPAARTAYEDSLTIAKALAEQDPKNTDWRSDLSIIYERLGDVAAQEGDLPAARSAYENSLIIAKALAAQDPRNTNWRRDLSLRYERLGEVCEALGDVLRRRGSMR